jgi:hypothetical protein
MLRRLILLALTVTAAARIPAQTQPQVGLPASQPISGSHTLRFSATLTPTMKEPQLDLAAALALP